MPGEEGVLHTGRTTGTDLVDETKAAWAGEIR
jgi:hypothetical protein